VFIAHHEITGNVDAFLGLDFRRQYSRYDYHATQELARLAREVDQAILVPSCTRPPEGNFVFSPDRLDPNSSIRVVESADLSLMKDLPTPQPGSLD